MKRATILVPGVLAALLVLATACGGGEASPTAKPAATAAPTATTAPVAPAAGAAVQTLEISAKGDALEFDNNKLAASAGSEVVLSFNNVSKINQHNWVLVKAGTKDDVAAAGTTAGPGNDWLQPGDDRVIANTKILNPGETGEVRFTVPAVGTYQFVCTFPGHNFTMFGDFAVTP